MEREEVYYVFRNAAGRILKILTRSLVSGNPALAAELSPVPLDALEPYAVGPEAPVAFGADERAILFYPAKDDAVRTVFGETDGVWWVEKRVDGSFRARVRSGFFQRALPRTALSKGEKPFSGDRPATDAAVLDYFGRLFAAFPVRDGLLPSEAVDALPRNCLVDEEGKTAFFDLEYGHEGGIRASFLVYRALKMDILPRQGRPKRDLPVAYRSWCERLGLAPAFAEDEKLSRELKLLFAGGLRRRVASALLSLVPSRRFRERRAWWSDRPVVRACARSSSGDAGESVPDLPRRPVVLLFVLWESARGGEAERAVLADMAAKFKILKQFEVLWTAEAWERHLQSFYGLVSPVWQIKRLRNGSGAFRVVIVEDPAPRWGVRADMRGRKDVVDLNAWDAKKVYRKTVGVKDGVHSSVNERETRQNLAMLLDTTLDDFLARGDLDGSTAAVSEPPAVERGWRDLAHFFRIMNECTPYLVLRNAHEVFGAAGGLHGDIDLLVGNLNEFTAFSGAVKVKSKSYHAAHLVNIGGRPVKFDLRTPEDGYYDAAWARAMLDSRVLQDGLYVPSPENAKWSLLYHALAHKNETSADYAALFATWGPLEALREACARWMNERGYAATRPMDEKVTFRPDRLPAGVAVRRRRRDFTPYVDARLTKKHVRLHLFPRCGVPNVFRVQIRLASLYKFDFCLGRVRDTVIL